MCRASLVTGPSAATACLRRWALIRQRRCTTKIIGVGGISTANHVNQYLNAGAEAVQLATAVMINPLGGVQIARELSTSLAAH